MSEQWRWAGSLLVAGLTGFLFGTPGAAPSARPRLRETIARSLRKHASCGRCNGSFRYSKRIHDAARLLTASYGYHVERGSLDSFIKTFQDRVTKSPGDGTGWLILGLLESQRGEDAAAVAAFQKAEATRPSDCLPAYYLGQALVLVGQPEQAAAAFKRALERKPPRNDLLEIFQALGRVYQRTQKNDQALQVWSRLEALFPNNARVQEQIALALAEENQPARHFPGSRHWPKRRSTRSGRFSSPCRPPI